MTTSTSSSSNVRLAVSSSASCSSAAMVLSADAVIPPNYVKATEALIQKVSGRRITPEGLSVLYMALAMAMHFFGYEFARSTAIGIFTSDSVGFTSASSLSLAMACVTPFSMMLLMLYNQLLEAGGPRAALRNTSLLCSFAILLSGLGVYAIENSVRLQSITLHIPFYSTSKPRGLRLALLPLGKLVVWILYLFQNSYAHLLYTQQWSFIGSILKSSQGARWFASITGVTSIMSTIAAGIVSHLVNVTSLPLLFALGTTSSLFVSLICAEAAYHTSDTFGFTPKKEHTTAMPSSTTVESNNKQHYHTNNHSNNKATANYSTSDTNCHDEKGDHHIQKTGSSTSISNVNHTPKMNMIVKATLLFQRVPALKLLCYEVISFTSLSTLMSVCLLTKMKTSMPDDSVRAAFSSKFWFYTNAVSGCIQFFILPTLFKFVEPRQVWLIMPTVVFLLSAYQSFQIDPALFLLSSAFFLTKVVDYVLRGVVSEMVRNAVLLLFCFVFHAVL